MRKIRFSGESFRGRRTSVDTKLKSTTEQCKKIRKSIKKITRHFSTHTSLSSSFDYFTTKISCNPIGTLNINSKRMFNTRSTQKTSYSVYTQGWTGVPKVKKRRERIDWKTLSSGLVLRVRYRNVSEGVVNTLHFQRYYVKNKM